MADATYTPKTYRTSGGDKHVIASGGELDIESGGLLKFGGTAIPSSVTIAAASAAATVCEVTYTVVDSAGTTLAAPYNLDIWLSDAATGAGLTATSASGTVTAKTASGEVLGTFTAKKALRVQTLATGIFILEITDSAKTAFYPCVALPATGEAIVGTVLATGDYGA